MMKWNLKSFYFAFYFMYFRYFYGFFSKKMHLGIEINVSKR